LKHKGSDCFHATDHCRRPDNAEIFGKLRELISRTSEQGFVRFALNETLEEFNSKGSLAGLSGDNHSLLTLACMEAVADYAKGEGSKVVYYIENGPNGSLRKLVNQIEDNDNLREIYALSNISFPTKIDAIQLQSADLLAWTFHRVDDSLHTPIPAIDPAPGFVHFKEWHDWYKTHDLKGFTYEGLENRTIVNLCNGLRIGKS
jgi:hypothetical protein